MLRLRVRHWRIHRLTGEANGIIFVGALRRRISHYAHGAYNAILWVQQLRDAAKYGHSTRLCFARYLYTAAPA